MRHKLATMAVSLVLLVGTVYLAIVIPKGFLPSEDIEQINGTTEAVEGVSLRCDGRAPDSRLPRFMQEILRWLT